MFEGVYPALVTPFEADSKEIDWESWERLLEWQIACGVQGVVIFGTTGESATLRHEEKLELSRRTVAQVKGRVPIIAGTGSNDTAASVALSREVAACGVDALLAVAPYYNKPTQEGMYQHFVAIADSVSIPTILYNVPGRTVSHLSIETISRLGEHQSVVACKQAVDSITELLSLSAACAGSLDLLAGDDAMFYPLLCCGGRGVISATASVFPEEMLAIWNAYQSADMKAALRAQQELLPAIEVLFSESNPIPAKAALVAKGIIKSDVLRLPLVQASAQTREAIAALLG